nr:MAG TPA: hypothetical protein [Caudoviricetes sp.]
MTSSTSILKISISVLPTITKDFSTKVSFTYISITFTFIS